MSTWREEFNKARAAGQGVFYWDSKNKISKTYDEYNKMLHAGEDVSSYYGYNTMTDSDNLDDYRKTHKDLDDYLYEVGLAKANQSTFTRPDGTTELIRERGLEWMPTNEQRARFRAASLDRLARETQERSKNRNSEIKELDPKPLDTNLHISKPTTVATPLNLNRKQTRQYMRSIGMNPYSYSGAQRKELRNYLNGKTTTKPNFLVERSNAIQSTPQNTGASTNTKTSSDYFGDKLLKNLNI